MKRFIYFMPFLLLTILLSCATESSDQALKITKEQQRLYMLLNQLSDEFDRAPNDATRKEIRKAFNDKIDSYLLDTLKGGLVNFRVKVGKMDYTPFKGVIALTLKCTYENVDYWMEQHYPNEDSMKNSSLYKNVIQFREGQDTTISFIYLPILDIEKDTYSSPHASIEVIPVTDTMAIKFQMNHKPIK